MDYLFYKRPLKSNALTTGQCSGGSCPTKHAVAGVPETLTFDKIIQQETASPCSLADLLNYLRFIEHSPEHLEFFLWHQDYTRRFEALSSDQKVLSPTWNPRGPFSTSPKDHSFAISTVTSMSTVEDYSSKSSFDEKERYASPQELKIPNLTAQQFSTQPFRAEISRIISQYIATGSPRELNISARDRDCALQALSLTTHPSAFLELKASCDTHLRYQSHPNFIRWTIANCTRPRMNFAYLVGVVCLLLGVVTGVLFTVSHLPRGWRLFGALFWAIGVAILVCAYKGICVVLMAMGHRRLLEPWEIPCDDVEQDDKKSTTNSTSHASTPEAWDEEPPWMQKHKKRSLISKVFRESVPVEDKSVRRLQNIIVIQSLSFAVLGTIPYIAIIISIPVLGLL